MSDPRRMHFLDGLRGVACLMVVIFHYWLAFSNPNDIPWYFDGQLAVGIFFVMSGMVLATAYRDYSIPLTYRVFSRLARLLIPTLIAFFISDVVIAMSFSYDHTIAGKLGKQILLRWSNHPTASIRWEDLGGLIVGFKDSTMFPVQHTVSVDDSVCVPLWTINYEILGSLLILFLTRIRSEAARIAILLILLPIIGLRELGLFLVGYVFRFYYQPRIGNSGSKIIAVVAAISLAGVISLGMLRAHPTIDSILSGLLPHRSPLEGLHAIGSTLVVLLILNFRPLRQLLEIQIFQFLGKISFSIYLIHWPIMLGIGGYLYYRGMSFGEIIVACLIITIPCAILFERYVDRPSIRLARYIVSRDETKLKSLRQFGSPEN
ncbi:acyltransferase family protein [Burkholderia sp. WAC0059]|uniref:acyltransferase family protein n=1 Tax=Burkholderia sp. WAC0059 TaxID=2066022 RepID=UPI0015E05EE5|nr:acyltransferase [Burkholderia sp. WAC0059]